MGIFSHEEPKRNLNWIVYALVNHTRKKIFFGLTAQLDSRLSNHSAGIVKITEDWDFGADLISAAVIEDELSQKKALEYVLKWKLEKFEGFEVIFDDEQIQV